MLMRDN